MTDQLITRKSILARLLANENISVIQTNDSTASFDVQTRTLRVPRWKDITDSIYDLFMGHEVGHALYTELRDLERAIMRDKLHKGLINIIEDIRIEKLILDRYPGLTADFLKGYAELFERDFFLLKKRNEKIEDLGFLNRLNIHAKMRGQVPVPFSAKEQPYVDSAMSVETWEDVIRVYDELKSFLDAEMKRREEELKDVMTKGKKEESGESEEEAEENVSGGESEEEAEETDGETPDQETEEESDKEGSTGEGEASGSEQEETDSEATSETEEPEPQTITDDEIEGGAISSSTQDAVEEKMREMGRGDSRTWYINGYTDAQADALILTAKEATENRKLYYGKSNKVQENWNKFKRASRERVNVLVNEFERKKAADETRRGRLSDRGVIDVNRLYRYKYDDQIFKQNMTIKEGKSHGIMMFVDFSGSMDSSIYKVIEQLIVTTMFCQRVGVPFVAYGFSDSRQVLNSSPAFKRRINEVFGTAPEMDNSNYLIELLSSKMGKREFEETAAFILHSFYTSRKNNGYGGGASVDQLGATPYHFAATIGINLITRFVKQNRTDIPTVIFLTDGGDTGGLPISYNARNNRPSYAELIITQNGHMIRACKGITHKRDELANLLSIYKKIGVRTMHYFLTHSVNYYYDESFNKASAEHHTNKMAAAKEMAKMGFVTLDKTDIGYDRSIVINPSRLAEIIKTTKNNSFDLHKLGVPTPEAGADTGEFAAALGAGMNAKKMDQLIAKKIADLVA